MYVGSWFINCLTPSTVSSLYFFGWFWCFPLLSDCGVTTPFFRLAAIFSTWPLWFWRPWMLKNAILHTLVFFPISSPNKIFKRVTTLGWWTCFLCFTFSFLELKKTKCIRILQIKTSQFTKFSKNSLSLSSSFMWPKQLNLHLQSGPTFTASTCLPFPLFLLIWEAFWVLFLFLPCLTVT